MAALDDIQYLSDSQGQRVAAVVPIELWQEIESERETQYLLSSPAMRKRLLESIHRGEFTTFEDARAKLGI